MYAKKIMSLLLIFMLAVFTLALNGCSSSPPPVSGGIGSSTGIESPADGETTSGDGATAFSGSSAPPATQLTLLAVDRSKSTEAIRGQLLNTAFDIGTNFDPDHDAFRLYRFGNSIEEVYSQLPEDDDGFALVLAQQVKASDPVPGTDYPRVLQTLADAAAQASEKEVRIVIVGDGLNDYAADPKFEKRYRLAARRLARNPHIKWVRFWGVDVGTREEIRSVFKPLGSRLQIQSLDQNPLAP